MVEIEINQYSLFNGNLATFSSNINSNLPLSRWLLVWFTMLMSISRSQLMCSQWSVMMAAHNMAVALDVISSVKNKKTMGGGAEHILVETCVCAGLLCLWILSDWVCCCCISYSDGDFNSSSKFWLHAR